MKQNELSPTGFTLLELLAVITILGLISLVVGLRYTSYIRYVRQQSIPSRVSHICTQARTWAKSTNHPVDMQLDASENSGFLLTNQGSKLKQRFFPCPGLKAFRSIEKTARDFSGINITSEGLAPSFAVSFMSADSRQTDHWLVISGCTGDMIIDLSEQDINQFVESLNRVKPR